ncbi:MAG: hypothetical protein M0Z85_11445 [Gammaproteobacteria bacterium]|nr:hypothetical protein [Gammaproteobacteria bacterium]
MHMLFAMMAHALVYIGMWQLVRHYHLSPWLVLVAGVVLSLLFRRPGWRRRRGRCDLDDRRERRERGPGE